MSNDFVRRGYNKIAGNYNETRNQFKNTKYLKQLNTLLPPSSTILDIGCGAGKPVDSYFINEGHKVIGIDISEKMIELANQNVPEANYKVQDMVDLKNGEYQINAVVSFYAIFHTPRKIHQLLLDKINSFLPKGGLILITMGSSEWEGKEQNFHGAEMFWSHYDSLKNRKLVEQAGFEILVDEIDESVNEQHQVILAKKNPRTSSDLAELYF